MMNEHVTAADNTYWFFLAIVRAFYLDLHHFL